MDENQRKKGVYATARQRKKLVGLITKHPELISSKFSHNFSQKDSQKLWLTIAHECNSIPGARKTWRQWKKTWQDMKSKMKKRHALRNGQLSSSVVSYSPAEQETLGIKSVSSTSNYQETTEFVTSEALDIEETFNYENRSNTSYSESHDSPPEAKVFSYTVETNTSDVTNHKHNSDRSKHSDGCIFNCNILTKQEQRKVEIKEDYLNFKKDYLKQKLQLMKEQTEALRSIARELSKK